MPTSASLRGNRRGFTLIELLTVIGIIVVLLGILLPVANTIIKKSHETDTRAQLARLSTAINNYYQNFNAYPGPIADSNLYGYNSMVPNPFTSVTNLTNCTSSENLVLGLVGGLRLPLTSWTLATPGQYDATMLAAASGPVSLNPNLPQQTVAFYTPATGEIYAGPTGASQSWVVANITTPAPPTLVVPEFLDKYSNPHPILYLRARVGAQTVVDVAPGTTGFITGSQYFSAELGPYWVGLTSGALFPTPEDPLMPPIVPVTNPPHYPSDFPTAQSYFQNPAVTDGITARNQNAYFLVSAGFDGVYGTKDDIIFPQY